MPEFVSVCQSVLCATVHKYRTVTTLLCRAYLSRHPQPVCIVILKCSWSEFCTGVDILLKHGYDVLHQQFSPIILRSNVEVNSPSPDQNVLGSNF